MRRTRSEHWYSLFLLRCHLSLRPAESEFTVKERRRAKNYDEVVVWTCMKKPACLGESTRKYHSYQSFNKFVPLMLPIFFLFFTASRCAETNCKFFLPSSLSLPVKGTETKVICLRVAWKNVSLENVNRTERTKLIAGTKVFTWNCTFHWSLFCAFSLSIFVSWREVKCALLYLIREESYSCCLDARINRIFLYIAFKVHFFLLQMFM